MANIQTEGNMNFYQYRWLEYAILFMTVLILASPIKAEADDIVNFRVLSESQDKLVLEIQSYYTGSQGPTAYLSVLPTINGQLTSGIGYSAGSCPNSNNISTGSNSTCMTLSLVNAGQQIVTNGLEICMFGGASRNKFYCESFGYTKSWGSSGTAQPLPGGGQSDLQVRNVSISPNPLVQSQIQLHMYRSYRIQVSILNSGAPSPSFTVRTECNRNGMKYNLGETHVGPIAQNQTRDAVYDIFPSSAGAGGCMMRTIVDADRQVNESDESPLSNVWDRTVTILP
jgi:hypothetical protein